MKLRFVLLFFVAFSVLAVWADGSLKAEDSGAASLRHKSPEGATVAIVNIRDGDTVTATFLVQFGVTGMGIAPAGSNIENTGHHHLLVDVDELPDPNLPLPKNEQVIHFGGGQTETELTLPEGAHTLQLEFADYSHVPFDPVVVSERITIQVSADANGMLAE